MPLQVIGKMLAPRQSQALLRFAFGDSAKQVALSMHVEPRTAKGYATALQYKLHAKNTPHMITKAFELGVLEYAPEFIPWTPIIFGGTANAHEERRKKRTERRKVRPISRFEILV